MYIIYSVAFVILLLVRSSVSITSDSQFVRSNNELALDLLHAISSDNNIFYSPTSIASILNRLLLGAKGDTEKELRQVLHLPDDAKIDVLNQDLKELLELSQTANNENQTLKFASRLYTSKEFPLSEAYTAKLTNKDSVESVNFLGNAKNVTKEINQWVSNTTNGKIANLFKDSLSPETKLALVSAVLFISKWATPFNKESTQKGEFYNLGANVPALIDTMTVRTKIRTTSVPELNAELIELPYANRTVSMYILLPDSVDGIDEMNEKLTLDNLNAAIKTMDEQTPSNVQLFLPKFKIEAEYDLREPLEALDVKTMFTDASDLSGISDKDNLKVDLAVHKSWLEVDEEGTKAVAATGVTGIVPLSLPIFRELRVNNPFTFLIRMNNVGLIIFAGQVRTLVDEQLLSYGFI